MSNSYAHPFHLVDESPWPLISSLMAFFLTSSFLFWFHFSKSSLTIATIIILLATSFQWWNSVTLEGTYLGLHTSVVQTGLRWGMVLFIISEVFFFLSFFSAFFFLGISASAWAGGSWPPEGLMTFNPLQVPLLNTLILLASGVTVTWSHHSILDNNYSEAVLALSITILLGGYFSGLQGLEYWEASFSISDSAYGSCFFLMTGFHGFHVLVGTAFLASCLARLQRCHLSSNHHFMFEAAAWYWHFVDVVWLFLYISVYWWGKN